MSFFKYVIGFFFFIFSLQLYVFATPQFAKETKLSCSTCHSSPPALNDMGRMFLRNGFRFSKEDKTTLKKFLDQKESNTTYMPLAVMLSTKYNSVVSNDSKTNMEYKIYFAGTLTSKLSYFISYSDEKHRGYLQYNTDESKHVFRVGKLSPFTQLTSINRLSAGSALRGNNGNDGKGGGNSGGNGSGGNGKGKGGSQNSSSTSSRVLSKYGGQSSPPKGSSTNTQSSTGNNANSSNNSGAQGGGQGGANSNRPYKDPVQNSYFREYNGIEYSYQYNYNTIFMIGFGKTSSNSTNKKGGSKSSNNANNDLDPDSADKNQLVLGVRHTTDNGYALGFMIDKIPDSEKTSYSTLFFMEKNIDKLYIYLSFIYKNNKGSLNNYYGTQNGLIYQINDMSNIKTVVNFDRDENEFHNKGYLVSYSIMYKRVSLTVSAAIRETQTKKQNILQLSAKIYF